MCDITASIVDLAVRGYLKIVEREQKGVAGWLKGNTYSFELLKESDEWSELTSHERKLMSGLFEGGLRKVVDLDDLEHEFYKHMTAIREGIFDRLLQLGYYHHRPDQVRSAYLGGGIATMVFLLVGLGFLGETFEPFYFPLSAGIVAAVLTALPIIGFGMVMPARTVKGARQLEHVPRFPGVSRPGRSGSLPAHDRFTRDVRAVPSSRHGAPGGKEVGSSLRGLV